MRFGEIWHCDDIPGIELPGLFPAAGPKAGTHSPNALPSWLQLWACPYLQPGSKRRSAFPSNEFTAAKQAMPEQQS